MSLTTLYESDEVEPVIAPQKPEKRSSVDSTTSTTSTTSTSSWRSSSSSSRMKRLSARFSGLFFGGSRRSSMQSMAPPPAAIRRSSSTPVLNGRMSDETLRDAPATVTPAFLAGLANFDYDSFGPTPRRAGKWRAQDQWRPEDLQGNYAIM